MINTINTCFEFNNFNRLTEAQIELLDLTISPTWIQYGGILRIHSNELEEKKKTWFKYQQGIEFCHQRERNYVETTVKESDQETDYDSMPPLEGSDYEGEVIEGKYGAIGSPKGPQEVKDGQDTGIKQDERQTQLGAIPKQKRGSNEKEQLQESESEISEKTDSKPRSKGEENKRLNIEETVDTDYSEKTTENNHNHEQTVFFIPKKNKEKGGKRIPDNNSPGDVRSIRERGPHTQNETESARKDTENQRNTIEEFVIKILLDQRKKPTLEEERIYKTFSWYSKIDNVYQTLVKNRWTNDFKDAEKIERPQILMLKMEYINRLQHWTDKLRMLAIKTEKEEHNLAVTSLTGYYMRQIASCYAKAYLVTSGDYEFYSALPRDSNSAEEDIIYKVRQQTSQWQGKQVEIKRNIKGFLKEMDKQTENMNEEQSIWTVIQILKRLGMDVNYRSSLKEFYDTITHNHHLRMDIAGFEVECKWLIENRMDIKNLEEFRSAMMDRLPMMSSDLILTYMVKYMEEFTFQRNILHSTEEKEMYKNIKIRSNQEGFSGQETQNFIETVKEITDYKRTH